MINGLQKYGILWETDTKKRHSCFVDVLGNKGSVSPYFWKFTWEQRSNYRFSEFGIVPFLLGLYCRGPPEKTEETVIKED